MESNKTSVKLMSANLWGLPTWLPFSHSKDKGPRFKEFAEVMRTERPDILCVQELWLNRDLKALREKFAETGLLHDFSAGGFVKNRKGLATFSRYPIVGERMVREFANGNRADFSLKKNESPWPNGFSSIFIDVEGKTYAVINVHLTYFNRSFDSERGLKVTREEIKELFDYIELIRGQVAGIFVCGDFNIDIKNTPSLPKILKVLSDVSAPTLEQSNLYAAADGYSGPDITSDFILGPESAEILDGRIIKSPLVSDHYPVVSEIRI